MLQKLDTDRILEDQKLVQQYVETRKLEVLGRLFQPYMELVYGVCLKYLKNRETSQDAVMQIFETLVTEIPKRPIENFRSWLYVVSKNHCLMEIRKEKSKIKHMDSFIAEKHMESFDEMHPLDESPMESLNTRLNKCMQKLKAEQKECIDLFYYKKKCYREIADILNFEEKKVKSYIQNGKRNLKICLEASETVYEEK